MVALAANWRNAFDPATGLASTRGTYYEGTFANYSFRYQPDMAARIALCGGGGGGDGGGEAGAGQDATSVAVAAADSFRALLDSFFGFRPSAVGGGGGEPKPPIAQLPVNTHAPNSYKDAMSGAGFASHTFEGLCNEPDMETPFAYLYANGADRLARVLHGVKAYSFAPGRGGVAGNIDSGGEAAWFVWASVGIHPAPGLPIYFIGVPSFAQLRLRLGTAGAALLIKRVGTGMYVAEGSLNGTPLDGRAWMRVAEAEAGGVLTLTMSTTPAPAWGSVPPPSWPSSA